MSYSRENVMKAKELFALKRTDAEEELLFIARAGLPEAIDEGTNLKYEFLQYEII